MTIEREQIEDDIADIAAGRPTVDDLQQVNFSHPAVLVRTDDPVAVQQLPCVSGGSFNRRFGTGDPAAKLIGEDDRRARATIISDEPIFLGTNQAAVDGGTSAIWPANVPYTIQANEQWWAKAEGAATATVSVIVDQWSV